VLAGPVEATALGNIMAQMVAGGECATWAEAREIIRDAFPLATYEPRDTAAWNAAYARFRELAL
jgi:rhamnulokinase